MRSATKGAAILAVLLAALLNQPLAWGQLRIRSGAAKGGIEHPRALEQKVFQFTNEARRKNGLPALEADDTLTTLARSKCDDMIKRHYFSHTNPDGKTIRDLYIEAAPREGERMIGVGENISMSQYSSDDLDTAAHRIVDGFMVSPGHRQNILGSAYTNLGIGIAVKGKECLVTQTFGVGRKKL